MFSSINCRIVFVAAFQCAAAAAFAQPAPLAPREVPAKMIPVPNTVSPELQQIIAQPLRTAWNTPPTTPEGWKQLAESLRASAAPNVDAMRQRLKVKVEPGTMAGVRIYDITPETIRPENRERVLVQIHGGCYVLNRAEAALPEAMLIAAIGGYRSSPPSAATASSRSTTACRRRLTSRPRSTTRWRSKRK